MDTHYEFNNDALQYPTWPCRCIQSDRHSHKLPESSERIDRIGKNRRRQRDPHLLPDRHAAVQACARQHRIPVHGQQMERLDEFHAVHHKAAAVFSAIYASAYDCMRKAVEFGIPKEQAILSATLIPAREIGREKEIGAIAPGKLADFVVCDGELNQKTIYLDGKKL